MKAALLITGLVWVLLSMPLLAATVWQVRRGEKSAGILDAVLAFVTLIWVATGPSILLVIGSAENLEDLAETSATPDPDLVVIMVGTSMIGTLASAMFCWLRSSAATLGLVRMPLRWALIAAVGVLPMMGIFWLGEVLVNRLGIEIEPQMISIITAELPVGPRLLFLLLMVVLVAPILEEVVFRGFIQRVLVCKIGVWPGLALTAIFFGLIHVSDPQAVIPVTMLGLALGWLREKTGSLLAPLILHVVNNAGAMLLVRLLDA